MGVGTGAEDITPEGTGTDEVGATAATEEGTEDEATGDGATGVEATGDEATEDEAAAPQESPIS